MFTLQDEWKTEYSSYGSRSSISEDDEIDFDFLTCRHRCSDLIALQMHLSSDFHTFSNFMLSRETIWMFMGVDKLSFYLLTDAGYLPSKKIPQRLFPLLRSFCHTSNKLRHMRLFCHTVLDTSLSIISDSNRRVTTTVKIHPYSTLTFQAFSSSVRMFLYDIDSKLLELEGIQNFVESCSLLTLYDDLEILSEEVSYFHSIFLRCISPPKSLENIIPIYEVRWLLDCLWQELSLCELQLMVIPQYSRIPISLLLISLAPLFNFISQWFYSGFITDIHNEFFIEQLHFPVNCHQLSLFWTDGCNIRCDDNILATPSFFIGIENIILSSGKSLGSLGVLGEKIAEEQYGMLYFTFIDNIFKCILSWKYLASFQRLKNRSWIPNTKHKFDFLLNSIDYNNYISSNVL
ncbi:Gamma-tubulin complex component 5 [Oopsacas minuta]|uniref:Gamma-tubulin complex component n=1 Tax=Oopsacas minuta TaxID=111878 RepID=A0AAV7JI33_9METZ|nr:Gamma-tubulin complex component 5 [Oopsacas minuta]